MTKITNNDDKDKDDDDYDNKNVQQEPHQNGRVGELS